MTQMSQNIKLDCQDVYKKYQNITQHLKSIISENNHKNKLIHKLIMITVIRLLSINTKMILIIGKMTIVNKIHNC